MGTLFLFMITWPWAAMAAMAPCQLDSSSLPPVFVVGEVHKSALSRAVGKILLRHAKEERIEIASEVNLSDGNGLKPWHLDVRENKFVHAIEHPVLHGLVGSMFFLDSIYESPTNSNREFSARLCEQAYLNPFSLEVLAAISQEEPGLTALGSWVEGISRKATNGDYRLETIKKDCQQAAQNFPYSEAQNFSPLRLSQLYPHRYFPMAQKIYGRDPVFSEGIEYDFPREASREYVANRKLDHKIFFLARERFFNQNSHRLLCNAQERKSRLPFLILLGSMHNYGVKKHLEGNHVPYKEYFTFDEGSARALLEALEISDRLP